MKKILLSAALLASSLLLIPATAFAQDGPASARHAAKAARRAEKQKAREEKRAAHLAAAHGSAVSTLAQTTPLSGADKGAAISALASDGRSAARGARPARPERSARGRHGRGEGDDHKGDGQHSDHGRGHQGGHQGGHGAGHSGGHGGSH